MKCKKCEKPIVGRTDKQFCSAKCKAAHHRNQSKKPKTEIERVNKILLKNYKILNEIVGEKESCIIPIPLLESKKFFFGYVTKVHFNSQGKMYQYLYDLSFLRFRTDTILVYNNREKWKKSMPIENGQVI